MGLEIIRVVEPTDAAKLYPWLVPTKTEDRMQIACELADRLDKKPDETLCLVAIENNIARAVVIAYVSEQKKRTVWLWQAAAESSFEDSKLLWEKLILWAKDQHAREIRMGTDMKRQKAFQRRWGFTPCGHGQMRIKL